MINIIKFTHIIYFKAKLPLAIIVGTKSSLVNVQLIKQHVTTILNIILKLGYKKTTIESPEELLFDCSITKKVYV